MVAPSPARDCVETASPSQERVTITDAVSVPCGGGAFTAYEIAVCTPGLRWEVRRRFSSFLALREQLAAAYGFTSPPIPWKSPLGGSHPWIVSQRRDGLQAFLRACFAEPQIADDRDFREFLGFRHQQSFASSASAAPRHATPASPGGQLPPNQPSAANAMGSFCATYASPTSPLALSALRVSTPDAAASAAPATLAPSRFDSPKARSERAELQSCAEAVCFRSALAACDTQLSEVLEEVRRRGSDE